MLLGLIELNCSVHYKFNSTLESNFILNTSFRVETKIKHVTEEGKKTTKQTQILGTKNELLVTNE